MIQVSGLFAVGGKAQYATGSAASSSGTLTVTGLSFTPIAVSVERAGNSISSNAMKNGDTVVRIPAAQTSACTMSQGGFTISGTFGTSTVTWHALGM